MQMARMEASVVNRSVGFFLGLAFAFVALAGSARAEGGDTRIKLGFTVKATLAENRDVPGVVAGSSGPARHNFTVLLKPDGVVSESYEGSGRFVLVNKGEAVLGQDGNRLQYRVVDQNTIERISQNDNQVQTVTVKVDGKSCPMAFKIELKPGKTAYVAYSQSRGRMLNYRSFELVESSCMIE